MANLKSRIEKIERAAPPRERLVIGIPFHLPDDLKGKWFRGEMSQKEIDAFTDREIAARGYDQESDDILIIQRVIVRVKAAA